MRAFDEPLDRSLDLDADIKRARASKPADLTDAATLEEMLARPVGSLPGDDNPGRPYRRNLESKLDAARAKQRRTEEVGAMTPQQIVDQIPRGF